MVRLPGGEIPRQLAERLQALDYTVEGVRRLTGDSAAQALDRGEVVAASRQLKADRSPLATVLRLFVLGEALDAGEVQRSLGLAPGKLDDVLTASGSEVRAAIDLAPCATDDQDWLIASDWPSRRTGVPTATDHVLGVGGASTMLAQCTVRPRAERSLDIGTGCGVQAFHLAAHSEYVVATDVSERCLEFARFNAALNGFDIELRKGSLSEPLADEQFDLVVSNPPFVIGSPSSGRHDYRDFGGSGEGVCGQLVDVADTHLREGGWCQMLANWEIADADDWSANPREWVSRSGLDAWVIQREMQDPALYVETWLRDSGERHDVQYMRLYDEWLSTLERRGVVAVGFGLVTLRRGEREAAVRRFQHAPQAWRQPVAHEIQRWFAVHDALAADPSSVLTRPLAVAEDVVLEQHSWSDPAPLSFLRRTSGMCWSGPVDAFGLEVLAGLDGVRPAAEAVIEAAGQHGIAPDEALTQAVPALGRLAEEGFVRGLT